MIAQEPGPVSAYWPQLAAPDRQQIRMFWTPTSPIFPHHQGRKESAFAVSASATALAERHGITYITVFDGRSDRFDSVVARLSIR